MPSPFHGINLASGALRAFQRGMDVTGHNISNVNTVGYTRQTIDFSTPDPTMFWNGGAHMLGNGVNLSSINRARDMFLEARRQGAQGETGRLNQMAEGLSQIQTLFLEPGGSGIADAMDKFFNAWSGLASNPNEAAARVAVQQAGSTLASRIRTTYLNMQAQSQATTDAIKQTINDVNTLSSTINDLNKEIRLASSTGAIPNDLLDARDQALRQLGSLVDITTVQQPDGGVTVYMNQWTLIDATQSYPLPPTYNTTTGQFSDANFTYDVGSGKLKGLFDTAEQIKAYQGQLDDLANNLRTQVNGIHETGTNPLGGTNVRFFNDVPVTVPVTPQTGAIDFDLDPAVKADSKAIVSSVTGLAGDGGLALSLSRLREQAIGGLGGETFGKFFNNFVADVGRQTDFYQLQLKTQEAINMQIDHQIQAVSGVSLDDEMANMLRFQRSYQAAARALSMFDQMTEDLINIIR